MNIANILNGQVKSSRQFSANLRQFPAISTWDSCGQGEAEAAREHHRKAVAVREAAEPLQALVEAVSVSNAWSWLERSLSGNPSETAPGSDRSVSAAKPQRPNH